MSEQGIPPYFGSWEELVDSVLRSTNPPPGGRGRPHPESMLMSYSPGASPWSRFGGAVFEPHPEPWLPPVSYMVSLLSLKEVIDKLPEGHLRQGFSKRIDASIADILEDWCGTKPRPRPPWPWPGPPPWIFSIVTNLTLVANSLQEGRLRNEILDIAGQVVQKSFEAGMD